MPNHLSGRRRWHKNFSEMTVGDPIDVMGPLGNGFRYHHLNQGDTAFIVGGGIGVPPLYELSKRLTQQGVHVIHFWALPAKTSCIMKRNFAHWEIRGSLPMMAARVYKNVGNLLLAAEQTPAAVFACGNNGLLKPPPSFSKTFQMFNYPWRREWLAGWVPVMPVFAIRKMMNKAQKCQSL